MKKRVKNLFRNYALSFTLALIACTSNAYADDIFKGLTGPKGSKVQLDSRFAYARNEKDVITSTYNIIGKYWDGDKLGKWAFVSLPYKSVTNDQESINGVGNITVAMGPRGRVDNLHILPYFALTLPTGDSDGKIVLGNDRLDKKIGIFYTYLTSDKRFEVDTAIEYNFTGVNNKSIDPANEFYFGFLFGGKISEKIRFATGLTDLVKEDGNFLLNSRSVLRYTFSPKLHLEALIDHGIQNHDIPKYDGASLFLRYNL